MRSVGTVEAALRERLDEAAHALAAGADVVAGGDDRDAAVAELDQVVRRLHACRAA